MKLVNQVCLLSQTIKLEELGVYGFSLFHWWDNNAEPFVDNHSEDAEHPWLNDLGNAFTTAELLIMNGETITINYMQLEYSAQQVADHIIHKIINGELSAETCNNRLVE